LLRLFSHTGDGAWAVDADQRILFWNEAAEQVLGYDADQAVGRFCYDLLNLQDAEGRPQCRPGCALHALGLQGEALSSIEASALCRDGQSARISISLIAVPESAGTASRIGALVHLFRPAQPANGPVTGLRLHLLGPVHVYREDGSSVEGPHWKRAKVRALLAMLALKRSQFAHREELLERLWPNLDRPAALHNLNSTVYSLRRSLEPGLQRGRDSRYLHNDGEGYVLTGGPAFWVDLKAFERGIRNARCAPDRTRARALYEEALALYRGAYLADLDADLLDCSMERERVREHFLNASQELAELHAAEGDEDRARELCLQVLRMDACHEAAVRCLMRLSLRQGDRAAALACYRYLEDRMLLELGLSPSPETRLLFEEILSQDGSQPSP
jgi:PAS domain S-box-containing protein